MKRNQVLQAIFLGLILVGLFAMMAQNGYGFTVMGMACFGLALLYAAQGGWKLVDVFAGIEQKDIIGVVELFLLAILLMLFGFRAFYIRPPFIDFFFMLLCGLLMAVYFFIGSEFFKTSRKETPGLAWNTFFFYLSIFLLLLSLAIRIIRPVGSVVVGAVGFVTSVPFLISVLEQKRYDYLGKTISAFQFVVDSKNKAGLLFLFFLSSAVYTGLTYTKIIPAIENASMPRTYIEMINNAEAGREEPEDGKFQHEKYKEEMDKFLEKHGSNSGQ